MARTEQREIATKNGHTVSSTFYFPDIEMKGAILIVPAMGVTQAFYAPFAAWLTTHGYMVATFDYSGTGLSQTGHLRDARVTITDWADFDCTAMVEAMSNKANGTPLYWIGHSLGGQLIGMISNLHLVTKAFSIASGSGYWLDNVPSLKWRVWWLWFFVVPLTTRIYGYFPGKRLRKVGDLPSGVINQWRKWCLNPHYMVGAEGQKTRDKYRLVSTPIYSFSFTDDELMSKKNIDSLNSFYPASTIQVNRITPEEIGTQRIGHFGFFNVKFEQSLWASHLLPELH
ncbi:alpha/beta fold hydrolase [Agarivorans sp. TSD2052]|uniref:alpha/beta hydrolase family protein n=1 Tax=Agarivorans sp. TSD2052 TaxID=2937286 RepID=UPI00200FCCCA|nr:alpha/beta fold hydrolase [Agarivorans sp. TSD2052]UPW17467.1 alpha/beta fold hydrolase [Agarivorans sp. TSD2052]